ncbi:hypothetical protein [Dysgonomonas reticulitermitis]
MPAWKGSVRRPGKHISVTVTPCCGWFREVWCRGGGLKPMTENKKCQR